MIRHKREAGQLLVDPPIDLNASLLGGQAFRWQETGGGWYSGVIRGCFLKIRQIPDGIEFRSNQPGEIAGPLLESYFRLDDDTNAIHANICRDPRVAEMVSRYPGMRLLHQEPWECLVAYICSANNNVPRISAIVEGLSKTFGDPINLDNEERHTFPTPIQIIAAGEEALRKLKLGLKRAPNIYRAAIEVSEGSLDLDALLQMPYNSAKNRLLECSGIGHKIADCVALFSLDKLEAFPIDRWIGRALVEWYFPGQKPPNSWELPRWAESFREHFGQYAGYAGQFLFHGMRMGKQAIRQ